MATRIPASHTNSHTQYAAVSASPTHTAAPVPQNLQEEARDQGAQATASGSMRHRAQSGGYTKPKFKKDEQTKKTPAENESKLYASVFNADDASGDIPTATLDITFFRDQDVALEGVDNSEELYIGKDFWERTALMRSGVPAETNQVTHSLNLGPTDLGQQSAPTFPTDQKASTESPHERSLNPKGNAIKRPRDETHSQASVQHPNEQVEHNLRTVQNSNTITSPLKSDNKNKHQVSETLATMEAQGYSRAVIQSIRSDKSFVNAAARLNNELVHNLSFGRSLVEYLFDFTDREISPHMRSTMSIRNGAFGLIKSLTINGFKFPPENIIEVAKHYGFPGIYHLYEVNLFYPEAGFTKVDALAIFKRLHFDNLLDIPPRLRNVFLKHALWEYTSPSLIVNAFLLADIEVLNEYFGGRQVPMIGHGTKEAALVLAARLYSLSKNYPKANT